MMPPAASWRSCRFQLLFERLREVSKTVFDRQCDGSRIGKDSPAGHGLKPLRRRSLLLFLAVFVVGTVLSAGLATRFTRPIRRLDAGIRRLSEGDLDVEVAVAGRDEVARLGEAFNDMTRKLRATRDNAAALCDLAEANGGFGAWLASFPPERTVALWDELSKRFRQLGGLSGPYYLRRVGKDTFLPTEDVTKALKAYAGHAGGFSGRACCVVSQLSDPPPAYAGGFCAARSRAFAKGLLAGESPARPDKPRT